MENKELKETLKKYNLLDWSISELHEFISLIKLFKGSDERSYSRSYEVLQKGVWYAWIYDRMNEYNFVSGEPSENIWEKRPKACFWWEIYQREPAYYKPYYDHHCSSNNRQEQMINLLEDLIKDLTSFEA